MIRGSIQEAHRSRHRLRRWPFSLAPEPSQLARAAFAMPLRDSVGRPGGAARGPPPSPARRMASSQAVLCKGGGQVARPSAPPPPPPPPPPPTAVAGPRGPAIALRGPTDAAQGALTGRNNQPHLQRTPICLTLDARFGAAAAALRPVGAGRPGAPPPPPVETKPTLSAGLLNYLKQLWRTSIGRSCASSEFDSGRPHFSGCLKALARI